MEPPSSILGMGVMLHTSLHRPGRSRACDPGETSGDNDWNFERAEGAGDVERPVMAGAQG
jgi:hypothetical protein